MTWSNIRYFNYSDLIENSSFFFVFQACCMALEQEGRYLTDTQHTYANRTGPVRSQTHSNLHHEWEHLLFSLSHVIYNAYTCTYAGEKHKRDEQQQQQQQKNNLKFKSKIISSKFETMARQWFNGFVPFIMRWWMEMSANETEKPSKC